MENEEGGGGGFMQTRIMGLPAPLVIGVVALLAYLWFSHSKSSRSAGSPSTSGGGGSITTGNTRIEKGAVTIDVKGGSLQEQPEPPRHPKRKVTHHVTRPKHRTGEQKEPAAEQRREKGKPETAAERRRERR